MCKIANRTGQNAHIFVVQNIEIMSDQNQLQLES